MLSPLPRRDRRRLRSSTTTAAAFPTARLGRLSHDAFRGLLGVHSRYGLRTRGIAERSFPPLAPRRHERVPPIDPIIQSVKSKLRFLLGLLAQLVSQKRELQRHVPLLRSGTFRIQHGISRVQAVLSFSYPSTYLAGSLRSTGVTPLPRYYEPRRLPTRAARKVMLSPPPLRLAAHPVGSPRFLAVRSTRAAPNHPGEYAWCKCSLLPRRWQASPS